MNIRDLPVKSKLQNNLAMEIAIVGAGVSGLYSAYRLVVDGGMPANQVQIFEMGDRLGGRLELVRLPGMSITGELGGMRYMTSQEIVTSLIEKVFSKLVTPVVFPMGDPADLLTYYRKQRLRQNAWTTAQSQGQTLVTNYQLNSGDVGLNFDQLFNKVVYDVLAADSWFMANYGSKISWDGKFNYQFMLTTQDWDAVKPFLTYQFEGPYKGMKVNDMGFWNLLKDRTSQEGYAFLADAGGYYSNTINWNAAEAFPYMVGDFSNAATEYKTIVGGYDLIAYALAYSYYQKPGAGIYLGQRLLTFRYSSQPGYRYELIFQDQATQTIQSVFAKSIILAMPRRSLELLDQSNFFFNPTNLPGPQTNMASVIIEPSFKILMGFEIPWWKDDFGALAGHSITDLPMRQCYYFGTDPNDSHSLFLASYNDMRTIPFWEVLAGNAQKFVPRATSLALIEELQKLGTVQASQLMVNEVMNEVRELHSSTMQIPDPYVTWYKDWTQDPFGGGYHAWKAEYSIKDVMVYMRSPNPYETIYICGEAYSDQQGWVEGAFCTAEHMLQDHFQLTWPDWLDKNYYLGW